MTDELNPTSYILSDQLFLYNNSDRDSVMLNQIIMIVPLKFFLRQLKINVKV
jgi:hypothetical protein